MPAENFVITVSRQFGSYGRRIAQKLSHKLNINYYDRDLLDRAASMLGTPIKEVAQYDESMRSLFMPFAKVLHPLGLGPLNRSQKLFDVQRELILKYTEQAPCILVGRCSEYILRDYQRHLSVFIYAPFEQRVTNVVNELGMNELDAPHFLQKTDEAWNAYFQYFTGEPYDTQRWRDLMIDTSQMSPDDAVDTILYAARAKLKI